MPGSDSSICECSYDHIAQIYILVPVVNEDSSTDYGGDMAVFLKLNQMIAGIDTVSLLEATMILFQVISCFPGSDVVIQDLE